MANMTWRTYWTTLVGKIRTVHSDADKDAFLQDLATSGNLRVLAFVNAHAMNSVVVDRRFFEALISSDDLLLDGSGMAMLFRSAGKLPGFNMNGTDLIPEILSSFRGRKVALWGTKSPYLEVAAKRCESEFGSRVVSTENGFQELEHYVELAIRTQPDLIILGMGMPKQEYLAQAIRSSGQVNSLIVCGGAIIDFISGRSPRAPRWIRKLGLEWLFRLLLEPKRLFKRYVVGNPLFMLRVWSWKRSRSN